MERDYDSGYELLERARRCWDSASAFRRERDRCKRFTYGDQWSDRVDGDGLDATEEEHLRMRGHMPLKNNLIRRLVRNVLGVFRGRYALPVCVARDGAETMEAAVMQKLLRYNADVNRLGELYARTMEEFLISGMAVHKKWYGRKDNRVDCWTDFVQPDRFFIDAGGRDFRGWDINFLGEVHDMEYGELIASFAVGEGDAERIGRLYGGVGVMGDAERRCRVVEVWRREHPARWRCHDPETGSCFKMEAADYDRIVGEENRRRASQPGRHKIRARWYADDEWRWYFIAPGGEIIASGVSPYRHGGHPYVFKAYPFIDGEIHSFVGDIIDQQKLTNRLISMYDWILQASAKGVLLMPEGAVPAGVSLDEIADEWSRFDGVIVFKPSPGMPLPQQISSKAVDIGITELLNIQMKMMEDISGVNGALQGKLENGSMSGTLYNQQTRNSLSALSDLMQSFDDFIRMAAEKDVSNIGQYYTPTRIASIVGENSGLRITDRFRGDGTDFRLTVTTS